jgi:hypothetical protein
MEDITFSNTLTSPSIVFSYVALGSMDVEAPTMEKIDHVEPTTTTIPTSNESDYQGNNKGIVETMIPLVDMKNDELFRFTEDAGNELKIFWTREPESFSTRIKKENF